MTRQWRWWLTSGLLAAVVASGGSPHTQPARGQDSPPRPPSRFATVGRYRINLDQIVHVRQETGSKGDLGVEVFFTTPRGIYLTGQEARDLLAILDGKGVSPPGATPLPSRSPVAPGAIERRSTSLLRDDFDGTFALHWQTVRPDPTHASLLKEPGTLTITTQRGSIHAAQADDEQSDGLLARNLFLIDNPLAADADFSITTCVHGLTPTAMYQQAGLIVYGDDDNYLKWAYEYDWGNGGGQNFCVVVERGAVPTHLRADVSEQGLNRYWLRLTRQGDQFEYASSTDGQTFRVQGKAPWTGGVPRRLGIVAKNGGARGAPEVDAHFEFFEVRSLLIPTTGSGATTTPSNDDRK